MMISLKTIQTSFIPTKDATLHLHTRRLPNRKNSILCLCKSNDDGTEASPPEGDARAQDLLAKIVMLQTQKVRLTDYLDEKSAYLTQFAEEANAEMDQIGENALKGLDEAGDRIMENLESRMQAFEEAAEQERLQMEKNEKQLADFEGQIEDDRNEGLFFKNLALMCLLVIGIAEALISSSTDWRKVTALGLIFVALFSQFISTCLRYPEHI